MNVVILELDLLAESLVRDLRNIQRNVLIEIFVVDDQRCFAEASKGVEDCALRKNVKGSFFRQKGP